MEKLTQDALRTNYLLDADDVHSIQAALVSAMIHRVGKDPKVANSRDWFYALAFVVRGILSENNIRNTRGHEKNGDKWVYYLSLEYLTGRVLVKNLLAVGLYDNVVKALEACGQSIEAVAEMEFDAALGNGGLGRLAACFLDSLAAHGYPGFGYGIRYEYGMFTQRIENGQQVEHPENWLRYGNPWEFERPDLIYPVRFKGHILCFKNERGEEECQWVDAEEVIAMAYDLPISGYQSGAIANLRLWGAHSSRDFDLRYFNEGNYVEAVKDKTMSENLSKVLYPNDATATGQELRLKQEYFFVSASLQDILHRYMKDHKDLSKLHEKVAIQLNDTHPALAVPELMRLLMDQHHFEFNAAWDVVCQTFAYTNHTLLPEALETWSVDLLQVTLPRHLQLIYQINDQFLRKVRQAFPGDGGVIRRLSLVDDDHRRIRMAHLAIVGSHKVNGVAALHTELLRNNMFPDFDRFYPGKFVNMTNGITPRRWLRQGNQKLAGLITDAIGDGWVTDLDQLKGLEPLADDAQFRAKFRDIKVANKERFAALINKRLGLTVDPRSLFDTQVKRIHEYKRQLLNILHVITLYNRLRDNPGADILPRTVTIGGKAAPGYFMAKLIIRLINDVSEVVNNDRLINGRLKLLFFPNYNVSTAEVIISGSDLSEQISTAGTEASGTGNMKFALNGALTIGTLDGANVEICEEVGEDNIFIFGLDAEGVTNLKAAGYDPWQYYQNNVELKRVLDMIRDGFFNMSEPARYRPIVDALFRGGDHYMLLADYADYVACQAKVEALYRDPEEWTRKAILNVANMGKFSSDRTIHQYARDIWNVKPRLLAPGE